MCSGLSCGHQITSADVQNKLKGLQCLLDEAFPLIERDRFGTASILFTICFVYVINIHKVSMFCRRGPKNPRISYFSGK